MRLPNKLSIAGTVLALGGLTGVAMSAGAGKRGSAGTPAADIRTVTIQQTIHRYHQVVAGGSANGVGGTGAVRLAASYKGPRGGVATRPSGHKTYAAGTYAAGTYTTSKGVKTGPSGKYKTAKTGSGSTPGGSSTAPKTRASGTTQSTSSTSSKATPSAPTTKPSGSTTTPTETTGGGTTPPPTTKPSGGTGEKEKEGKEEKGHDD